MKMIFHYPLPIDYSGKSASRIRPIKMIEGFKILGYQVEIISGYGSERKKIIKEIKRKIINGEKYDFLYSESSTMPTALTEKHHLPIYPFLDFNFFRFCKKYKIKIGLFYRDIYWRFPEYSQELPFFKKVIAKIFYLYDLINYKSTIDILYLPSEEMAKYIPIVNKKVKALPPGHDEYQEKQQKPFKDNLTLLYVGGIGIHYKMHKLFNVINKLQKVKLIICTRKEEWEKERQGYNLSENIIIIHKKGEDLKEIYEKVDITLIFVEPIKYWEFALPFKLFEYIGNEKPIIASKGTLAATFVKENNIGWEIDYDENSLKNLLENLLNNPSEIYQKISNIKKIKPLHTWKQRAITVKNDLTNYEDKSFVIS